MGFRFCPQDGGHTVKVAFRPAPGERYCPTHGCPTFDSDPAAASKPGSSLRRKQSPEEKRAWEHFKRVVCRERCFFAEEVDGERRRPDHECTFPLDPHHLVEVQWMRRELVLPQSELIEVMFDPRIGKSLCRGGHRPVEARVSEFIYWDELPQRAIAFCEEVDDRTPEGTPSMLERLRLESPVRELADV